MLIFIISIKPLLKKRILRKHMYMKHMYVCVSEGTHEGQFSNNSSSKGQNGFLNDALITYES